MPASSIASVNNLNVTGESSTTSAMSRVSLLPSVHERYEPLPTPTRIA